MWSNCWSFLRLTARSQGSLSSDCSGRRTRSRHRRFELFLLRSNLSWRVFLQATVRTASLRDRTQGVKTIEAVVFGDRRWFMHNVFILGSKDGQYSEIGR